MRLGITVGDPAGIGPEITLKALKEIGTRPGTSAILPVIYGSRSALIDVAHKLALPVEAVGVADDPVWPKIAVVDIGSPPSPIKMGTITAASGQLAYAAIARAVEDAMAGKIAAIVTGPISKEAVNLAGPRLCRAHRHARRPHRQQRHLHDAGARESARLPCQHACRAGAGAVAGHAGAALPR